MKKTYFVLMGPVGAVITAIVASICCVGPLVLLMLGVTGVWIGNIRTFAPYRPLFILLTFVFLGVGFYKIYSKSTKGCEPGASFAITETRRSGTIILWVITVFITLLLILPYLIGLLS